MSVRWKKRNSKNRSKNEMVLKGLEEQRLKASKEESVSELKEKKNRKELEYVFDEEKKRYFPKSVYKEGMNVMEWVME
mgnify:CR=1 FL=1